MMTADYRLESKGSSALQSISTPSPGASESVT